MPDDIAVILGRMEAKLDRAISDHADHEMRIRSLEKARWLMVGGAAVAGGLAGKLVGLL